MPFGQNPTMPGQEDEEATRRMREAKESYERKRPGRTNQPRGAEQPPGLSPQDAAGLMQALSSPQSAIVSNVPLTPGGPDPVATSLADPLARLTQAAGAARQGAPAPAVNPLPASLPGDMQIAPASANYRAQATPANSPLMAGLGPTAGLRPGQTAPSVGSANTFQPNASLTSAPAFDPVWEGNYQNRQFGQALSRATAGLNSSMPAVRMQAQEQFANLQALQSKQLQDMAEMQRLGIEGGRFGLEREKWGQSNTIQGMLQAIALANPQALADPMSAMTMYNALRRMGFRNANEAPPLAMPQAGPGGVSPMTPGFMPGAAAPRGTAPAAPPTAAAGGGQGGPVDTGGVPEHVANDPVMLQLYSQPGGADLVANLPKPDPKMGTWENALDYLRSAKGDEWVMRNADAVRNLLTTRYGANIPAIGEDYAETSFLEQPTAGRFFSEMTMGIPNILSAAVPGWGASFYSPEGRQLLNQKMRTGMGESFSPQSRARGNIIRGLFNLKGNQAALQ